MADYFGLSYPHEFTSAASLLIALILPRVVTIAHYRFAAMSRNICTPFGAGLAVLFSIAIWLITTCRCFRFYAHQFTSSSATAEPFSTGCGSSCNRSTLLPSGAPIGSDPCFFSRHVGVWAAILVGLSIDYIFCSVKFRTDNLWAPLWLVCMSVLLNGALTIRRALIAGFLMGLCFGVSMKTLILVMSSARFLQIAASAYKGMIHWKAICS